MGWGAKGGLKALSSWEVYRWAPEDSSLGSRSEVCPPTFHRLVTNLDSTLQGTYQVTVRAQDRPSVGPAQEARITLNVSVGPCLQPPGPSASPCVPCASSVPMSSFIALHCGPELPCEATVLHEQGGGARPLGGD